jgi:hypothetical protein
MRRRDSAADCDGQAGSSTPATSYAWTVTSFILGYMVGVLIAAGIGSCALPSHYRNRAFESVRIGDSENRFLDLFGVHPSVREKPNALFVRYASAACEAPCAERLWFENTLSLDIEAWSLELDEDRRVIKKSHWVSP